MASGQVARPCREEDGRQRPKRSVDRALVGLAQLSWSSAALGTTMPSSSGLYPSFARALTGPARKTPASWAYMEQ
jgi:hypothetical protein